MPRKICWLLLSWLPCLPFLDPIPCFAQVSPSPVAPTLNRVLPLGMQRGTSINVVLKGANLAQYTGIKTSFPAEITIPQKDNNGQAENQLIVNITAPKDAPLGYHSIRLATRRGISNLMVFCIDDLPNAPLATDNHERAKAQVLSLPCVVAGEVPNLKSCYYRFRAKKGDRISFDVLAHRLGTSLDPKITVSEAHSGKELLYVNDSPGLQTDARATLICPNDGEYIIELQDALHRGGNDYLFRLRIGDFPRATLSMPMVAERGQQTEVRFIGPNIDDVPSQIITPSKDTKVAVHWLAPVGKSGYSGWPVALTLSNRPESVANEPNDTINQANTMPVPGGISGALEKYGDTDVISFPGKKGQMLTLYAETLQLYSPTLLYMAVKNKKGDVLAKSNPAADPPNDQRFDFAPPEDGIYYAEIQHVNFVGDAHQGYHLRIVPKEPSFTASLALDRWELPQEGSRAIPIAIQRDGYNGPIDLQVVSDESQLAGSGTIPAGQNNGVLMLKADKSLPLGAYTFSIMATAKVGEQLLTELVSVRDPVSQSLSNVPFPPIHMNHEVAVAIVPKPPYQLMARWQFPESVPTRSVEIEIRAERTPGFADAIALLPVEGGPPNIKMPKLPAIPKGQDMVKFKVDIPTNVPIGSFPVTFRGQTGGALPLAYSEPVPWVIARPMALQTDSNNISLKPKASTKLKVTAVRQGGYDGPITLQVRNLPANVTAAPATIAAGQTATEITLTAAENAANATKEDVEIVGTAPAANNQQAISPRFRVAVVQ